MALIINNIDDLKAEIYHLKVQEDRQRYALRQRFNSPSKIFGTVKSLFSKPTTGGIYGKSGLKRDYFAILSGIILPVTLKRTLFRKSNFIVKSLVGVASKKASKFITEDSVIGVWNKIKSLLPHKNETSSAPRKLLIVK